jgi:hypothetical protein
MEGKFGLLLFLLCVVVFVECDNTVKLHIKPATLFSKSDIDSCFEKSTGDSFREPAIAKINDSFVVFVECRDATNHFDHRFGDDFTKTRIMKTKTKDGENWSKPEYVLPVGYSKPAPIFDSITETLILQFNYFNSPNPNANLGIFQMASSDGGETWNRMANISHFFTGNCNKDINNVVRISAGNHGQTPSGRLIFGGMNNDDICTWYSDDHGKTYTVSPLITGSENSITSISSSLLFMTTRSDKFDWRPYRTAYYSTNGGASWGAPQKMPIQDDSDSGCSASVITILLKRDGADHSVLFFSEPTESKRTTLGLHCSWDNGKTWPSVALVNPGDNAGYSVMSEIHQNGKQQLLVVWEQKPNMLSYVFDLDWCQP